MKINILDRMVMALVITTLSLAGISIAADGQREPQEEQKRDQQEKQQPQKQEQKQERGSKKIRAKTRSNSNSASSNSSNKTKDSLKHYSRADLLVESFDVFNEPSLHFTLTA